MAKPKEKAERRDVIKQIDIKKNPTVNVGFD